ncbi:HNH endonuclease [Palleronia caenipelagi]|uniref:HNH endonuclease n=2 Tax=Palleronia caenipelagi TaxID=2489174 RepID=A0A547Q2Q2_9RHOB|nr:HNH endonuclease [Palleronia caenipelagi]
MAKLVLVYRADSIYDDRPDVSYDFPKRYIKNMSRGEGDWVVYYEPVKAGNRGYFAVAKISRIIENPASQEHFLAIIEPGTYLEFDRTVPRLIDNSPVESALRDETGRAKRGGLQQYPVRILPEDEFSRIIQLGLPVDLEEMESRRYEASQIIAYERQEPFERPVMERLINIRYREVAFRRKVRDAYDYTCALSGLQLKNGGGRPEVQAAHIVPVAEQGSDSVRNGLALSGTLHWMFDRGLVSVADDYSILVSRNKVPSEVSDRLLAPSGKLTLPDDPRDHPHSENLRWHRENVYGHIVADIPEQWR